MNADINKRYDVEYLDDNGHTATFQTREQAFDHFCLQASAPRPPEFAVINAPSERFELTRGGDDPSQTCIVSAIHMLGSTQAIGHVANTVRR